MTLQPQTAHPAPPYPPELPEGVELEPRWPWWYGPVAFLAALVVGAILGGIVGVALGASGAVDGDGGEDVPLVTIIGTLVVDVILVVAAVLFASMKRRPKAWHFGLRRTRFWPAVGWAALGMFAFYVFAGVYSYLVQPDAEQTVTQDLGLREDMALLVLGGLLVIVVAPIAEEVFFRGFFYRALRSSLPVLPAAAIDGVLFGVIHFTGSETLLLLPVLGALGFMFCLVYERTGSLYPVIGLHALNNTVAFGAQTGTDEAWVIGGATGIAMLVGCVLLPRFAWRAAPAAR